MFPVEASPHFASVNARRDRPAVLAKRFECRVRHYRVFIVDQDRGRRRLIPMFPHGIDDRRDRMFTHSLLLFLGLQLDSRLTGETFRY